MTELRILPDPTGKNSFILMLGTGGYPNLGIGVPGMPGVPGVPGMPVLSPRYSKKNKYRGYGIVPAPPFSPISSPILSPEMFGMPGMPGMPGMLGMPGMPVIPGMPGAYVIASATSTPSAPTGKGSTPPPPPPPKGTGSTSASGTASGTATPTSYTIITPPITNVRHLTSPDADPELRRKVVKHFYNQLKEVYFIDKFKKLFKYIVVENGKARLVKSYEELQKNANNYNDSKLKIAFITDNIFNKYDLEVLISKLIAKYSMLYSDDEYNMHWYTAKYKHAKLVKKAMYKKIKYRLQKKMAF
jgi:hypothetical protein